MMKSIRRAAKANEEGLRFLEVDETGKALRSFRSALKQLNEGCQSLVNGLPSSDNIMPVTMNTNEGTVIGSSSVFDGTTVHSKPIRLGEDYKNASLPEKERTPGNTTALYSEAFAFQEHDEKMSYVMTIEKHRFCSAILIFNTALALHQKAGKEDGHKAHLKALVFYGEAKNLLQIPSLEKEAESLRIQQEIMKNQVDIYYRLSYLSNIQLVWDELAVLMEHKLASKNNMVHKSETARSA